MTSIYGTFSYAILVLLASGHLILSEKNSTEERVKRNNNEFHLHSIQSRRLNDGKGYSPAFNKLQPPSPASHGRLRYPNRMKPVHVPPYAVKMEPLVQYSQRDPLYHDKEITYNITSIDLEKHSKVDTFADSTSNFVDYAPRYSAPPSYDIGNSFPSSYYKEPEPIIEIIIKESNETLPTPPTTIPPHPSTKEPIQVFYVKYKKHPTHTGKEEVVYEEPIPALTPLSTDIVENNAVTPSYNPGSTYPNPTPPSTTYRTIIRPDSEVYHGTGLKVTFGNQEEASYPVHRSSEAQKRDSVVDQSETQIDIKGPTLTERQHQPSVPVLEQRQGQAPIEFARYINGRQEQSVISHVPNQISLTSVQQQPLQIEDGSFEGPPPPSFSPQNNQPKVVFSQPYSSGIPFRPQHSFNFPQSVEQHPQSNVEFSQPDLGALRAQSQNQFQILNPHQQLAGLSQNSKHFPRVTQAILPQQLQYSQNSPFTNQEASFSPLHLNNVKPSQASADNRYQNTRPNYVSANSDLQVKPNRVQSSNEQIPVSYNPQLHHTQTTFGRNEYLQQQPFSNQKQLYQQQQQQQQLNAERQKQYQFDKVRQQQLLANQKLQQQRRPTESEKYLAQLDFVSQKSQEVKAQLDFLTQKAQEAKAQPSNIQPNYREVVTAGQQRSTTKLQKQVKTESPQVQPIKDGQIYKSISQSEEHQILNQIEPFAPKQAQQQFNVKQNAIYASTPSPDSEKFRSKLVYATETRSTYQTTTVKPSTSKFERANSTQLENQYTKANSENKKKESQPRDEKEKSKSNIPAQLAALPAEVPDDLREQLLASGILSNADIQILDYDKVGDIPIENLPPEALENLYGAGSAPVPSIAFPNASKSVEMKVVRYDPSTSEGQDVPTAYVQEDSTEVDPVVLNDSSYNRYLPLKIRGSQFPIPDSPLLKNKKITSVVVLAPVDYDYVQQEAERQGKNVPQVHGVRFVSGDTLKTLVKNPTESNFVKWIEKERETPPNKQSVILLVMNSTTDEQTDVTAKEIFMYDIPTGEISKLEGELSSAFVNVAESNAESEDLENLSESSNEQTPVSKMTSIPVYGAMSDQFKNKSRRAS